MTKATRRTRLSSCDIIDGSRSQPGREALQEPEGRPSAAVVQGRSVVGGRAALVQPAPRASLPATREERPPRPAREPIIAVSTTTVRPTTATAPPTHANLDVWSVTAQRIAPPATSAVPNA